MSVVNMSDKTTRSRAPNFNKEEQLLLFSVMKPYTNIIECKKTDSVKQIDKQSAWSKVAEVYNANTKGVKRTTENLISCYRNTKSKFKKQHSEAKMLLEDPCKKETLLNALEEHGKDWVAMSSSTNVPADVCQSSFIELQNLVKKDDALHKKQILGTGGGPPPSNEDPFMAIKKLIEPQIDGMYTIYDGDANLMEQFQKTKPVEEQIKPIEMEFTETLKENMNPVHSSISFTGPVPITAGGSQTHASLYTDVNHVADDNMKPTQIMTPSRTDFLRKKRAPELGNGYSCPSKKKSVNDSFHALSQEKMELVKLKRSILEMEMQHKTKLYALEIEDKVAENKFNAELRQKELHLMQLKINKESQ